MDNEKVFQMDFAKVYPLLVNKVVRKGRTKEEADMVISWLTGYSQQQILRLPIVILDIIMSIIKIIF
ncbi:MAG: DUF2200 family protein [Bacteroidales bacterium]|nr:DUF2200 family protein [Bacteroidales bacterium]